jgi:hypothetical protein
MLNLKIMKIDRSIEREPALLRKQRPCIQVPRAFLPEKCNLLAMGPTNIKAR